MMRCLLLLGLLALPIGLASSLANDALLRFGLWAEVASRGPGAGPTGGRDRLEASLGADGTDGAVGRELADAWRAAAADSLLRPIPVTSPYAETSSLAGGAEAFADAALGARTFAVAVSPGDALRVATRAGTGTIGGLVVDVLDAAGAVASHGPSPFDVRVGIGPRDGSGAGDGADAVPADGPRRVFVRVQPTPGAAGRFAVLVEARTALDFPVATDAERPVRSFFGMPRDGGAREHHGIDIFAPRGTPVVAAADGTVVRTGDSARGGLHVWQRAVDGDGESLGTLYYAHLDRVDVVPGTRVTRGTPLGTVGDTGNARTTPPHLHFGLYRRFSGPADPLPLTGSRRVPPASLDVGPALARWLAVRSARANVRSGPGTGHEVVASVSRAELVRVDAVAGDGRWVRVRTGDGGHGWMARSLLSAPAGESITLAEPADVLASPVPGAPTLVRTGANAVLLRLGRHGEAVRVIAGDAPAGWILDAASAPDG